MKNGSQTEDQKRAARRKKEKLGRRIHLPSGIWSWTLGRGTVVIRDPHNYSYPVNFSTLTGIPWTELEKARGKKSDYAITPALVRKHIEDVILLSRRG